MSNSRHLARAAALAAILPAASASADIVSAVFLNSQIYSYKVLHMPDVDQRRAALPAEGSMYCAPTSTFNIFAYAANHGFPNAPPEDGNWALQSKYIEANLWLVVLGNWMSTDPEDGTTGAGVKAGMDAMIAQAPYLKRVHKSFSSSYTPSIAKLTQYACSGWAMNFAYGRWLQVDTHGGVPVVERKGGHVVTLTRAYRVGSQWNLRYRDPADDTALSSQSSFKNTTRTPYDYLAYYGGVSIFNLRSMNALFETSGGTRVLDSFFGIRPIFGVAFSNTGDALGGGAVKVLDPLGFEGAQSPFPSNISISPVLEVLDFGFDGDFLNALVIARSTVFPLPARLRTLDLATGELLILDPAPAGLRRFATDRFGHIFAFDSTHNLYKLAEDGAPIAQTEAIPDPTEVAVHDGDDSVWIISTTERKIVQLSNDLSETLKTIFVPTQLSMFGDARFAIHPLTGEPWFMTDASDVLYGLFMTATGAPGVHVFTSPVLAGADSFSFGDDGELFVTANGLIHVLAPTGPASWAVNAQHPFHGLPGGSHLAMLRSSDNYDPDEHEGPQWRNLTQEELEENGPFIGDCPADLDGDDLIDGADLGKLLAAWGPGATGPADIDQDGDVDGADLGLLLSAWGACQ